MSPTGSADRNLLFGILALQMDFITRDQLVAGMNAWVLDKAKLLGQILVEQEALDDDNRAWLEAGVERHVAKHDNDSSKSLSALSSLGSARMELERFADPELQVSLALVSKESWLDRQLRPLSASTSSGASVDHQKDCDATISYSPSREVGVRYRILRPHAKGGLGEVFVAEDTELHREVALKEIQGQHAGHEASRNRFVLEAEITGGLEHPGIVPVYGLGTYADGRPFYAMRFIKGDNLKEAIERFHKRSSTDHADSEAKSSVESDKSTKSADYLSFEFRKLIGRFVDVCNAVAYAHSRGVLHRDLKPGNIMLGKFGETLVVDWGLAKVIGRQNQPNAPFGGIDEATLMPASSSVAETIAGTAIGTPAYMSPEQAAGKIDELGPATDVYSLGATLYVLLTNQPPATGKDASEILRKVQRGEVGFNRQEAHSKGIPAALIAICKKAIRVLPGKRYVSPLALAEDLEHWLADEPVRAWREPLSVRSRRWVGRHRVFLTSVAAAMLVGLVSLSIATRQLTNANEGLKKANKDKEEQLSRAEWLLYASKINLAQRAWDANDVPTTWQALASCQSKFRGWEHDFLFTQMHRNHDTFRGFSSAVVSLAFSPDGSRIACAVSQSVRVVNANTGLQELSMMGHTHFVKCVAFSPDGKWIASASIDRTVKVWEAATGKEFHTFTGHKDAVLSLAFDPQSKLIVSGGVDKKLRVWDLLAKEELYSLDAEFVSIDRVAFTTDGKWIAWIRFDRETVVWDLGAGREKRVIPLNDEAFNRLIPIPWASPDGKWLATRRDDGIIRIRERASGNEKHMLKGHRGEVKYVAFSPDSKRLASGSVDGTVKLWDLTWERFPKDTLPMTFNEDHAAFTRDNNHIVGSKNGMSIAFWDSATRREVRSLKGKFLALSPDGTRILSEYMDFVQVEKDGKTLHGVTKFEIRDSATGEIVVKLKGFERTNFRSMALSGDNSRVLGLRFDGTVRIWNGGTGAEEFVIHQKRSTIQCAGVTGDSKRILTAGHDSLDSWDALTGKHVYKVENDLGTVSCMTFTPDGQRFVCGYMNGKLRIWISNSMTRIADLDGHTRMVSCVAVGHNRIASGSQDKTIKLWDLSTGRETITLRGHEGTVKFVAFSPDGKRLVSGSEDRTIRVWDATMKMDDFSN